VTIACFGLAFKPDIDDLRESPALSITEQIVVAHPGPVLAVEPNIQALSHKTYRNINLSTIDAVQKEANILVLLVDHTEFKNLQTSPLSNCAIIDTRGAWQAN